MGGGGLPKHGLYLIDLDLSRGSVQVSDALKKCGPLLDRAAVHAAYDGKAELPVLVAESDLRAPLFILSKKLEGIGCEVCVVEDSSGDSRLEVLMDMFRQVPETASQIWTEFRDRTTEQVGQAREYVAEHRPVWQAEEPAPGASAAAGEGASTEVAGAEAQEPKDGLKLSPKVIARRVALFALLIGVGAALLLLVLQYEPKTRQPAMEAIELELLPGGGSGSARASTGSGSAPSKPDKGLPRDSAGTDESGEMDDSQAANELAPADVPEIELRESKARRARKKVKESPVDPVAMLLGMTLALSTSLLIPRKTGRLQGSGTQVIGVVVTAALVAFIWALFVRAPVIAAGGQAARDLVLTGGAEGASRSEVPDTLPEPETPTPLSPFAAFVRDIGGEPSSCAPELPKFEALLCEMREMGATSPPQDPEDAMAAMVGDDDALAGDDDSAGDGLAQAEPPRPEVEVPPEVPLDVPPDLPTDLPLDAIPDGLRPEEDGDEGAAAPDLDGDADASPHTGSAEEHEVSARDRNPRTVKIDGSSEEGTDPRPSDAEGRPGGASGGQDPAGGGGGVGGSPGVDRAEIAGGAAVQREPRKRRPLRTRLAWLGFGLFVGWSGLGLGHSLLGRD